MYTEDGTSRVSSREASILSHVSPHFHAKKLGMHVVEVSAGETLARAASVLESDEGEKGMPGILRTR